MAPSGTNWVEVVQNAELVLFVLFVSAGAILTAWRFFRYRRAGQDPPFLLKLNALERLSLAIPFTAILISRVAIESGWIRAEDIRGQLWWVLFTGGLAVLGAGAYAYAEAFLIEREESGDPPARETPDEDDLPRIPQ